MSLPKKGSPPTIDATVRVDLDRGLMWVLGDPYSVIPPGTPEREAELLHNCDEMGCGSAGAHVLAVVRFLDGSPSVSGVCQATEGEEPP